MLSIGRVAPGNADYYLHPVAHTPDGYYLGVGEASGQWAGTTAAILDLTGQVDPEGFRRLLAGCHPVTGDRLVANRDGRVGGFDLTFSAPKSVSILAALHPDPDPIRAAVADAHRTAIADALSYLEGDGVWARRGRGGSRRVPVEGVVAARFDHRSSRACDPQTHSHVVVANMVVDHAGRWSAPDGRNLYRHARAAGFVYQARLRHELTAVLGVSWGPVRSGQADLAGMPAALVERFSTRRHQIVDALETRGLSSVRAARVATLDTRPPKTPEPGDPVGLFDRWAEEARVAGVDPGQLAGLTTGTVRRALAEEVGVDGGLVGRLVGPDGLTGHASTFDRRAATMALAEGHGEGATLGQLMAERERLLVL